MVTVGGASGYGEGEREKEKEGWRERMKEVRGGMVLMRGGIMAVSAVGRD